MAAVLVGGAVSCLFSFLMLCLCSLVAVAQYPPPHHNQQHDPVGGTPSSHYDPPPRCRARALDGRCQASPPKRGACAAAGGQAVGSCRLALRCVRLSRSRLAIDVPDLSPPLLLSPFPSRLPSLPPLPRRSPLISASRQGSRNEVKDGQYRGPPGGGDAGPAQGNPRRRWRVLSPPPRRPPPRWRRHGTSDWSTAALCGLRALPGGPARSCGGNKASRSGGALAHDAAFPPLAIILRARALTAVRP